MKGRDKGQPHLLNIELPICKNENPKTTNIKHDNIVDFIIIKIKNKTIQQQNILRSFNGNTKKELRLKNF